MNIWQHIARIFPAGWRRSVNATTETTRCYRTLFSGHGGEREAQVVLADFANFTGFYRVNGPGMSAEDRAFSEGLRAGYGHIFRFLRMTDDEVRQLEEAARTEALADSQEGQTL